VILLLDGSSLLERAHKSPFGKDSFYDILEDIVVAVNPSKAFCAWDWNHPSKREKVTGKKRSRYDEVPVLDWGINKLKARDLEVPDLFYGAQHLLTGRQLVFVTDDPLCLQLVTDRDQLYDPIAKRYYDPQDISNRYGCAPRVLPRIMAASELMRASDRSKRFGEDMVRTLMKGGWSTTWDGIQGRLSDYLKTVKGFKGLRLQEGLARYRIEWEDILKWCDLSAIPWTDHRIDDVREQLGFPKPTPFETAPAAFRKLYARTDNDPGVSLNPLRELM
jgi:hypothetical protein